jgi:chaperonin GroEL
MFSNVLLKQASRRSAGVAVTAATRRGFAKEIKFGVEGRAAMLRGVDVLADAVQVRLQV